MDYDDERKRITENAAEADQARVWPDLGNVVISGATAGGLAWWAYGTVAHALLFAFVVASVAGVGNSIRSEMRRQRLLGEKRWLHWRTEERLNDDILAGRIKRRGDA